MAKTTKPKAGAGQAELLVKEHQRFLAFLRRRVRTEQEAEEILQAAYHKGLKNFSDLKKDESLVAWFFRLLRNSLIDHYRRRAVETKAMDQYVQEAKDSSPGIDTKLEKAVCACYKSLLKSVKPEYAEILQKVDLEEVSLQDYARRQKLTPNNATVRIHRARKVLKEKLVQTCGRCAHAGCLDCGCKQV